MGADVEGFDPSVWMNKAIKVASKAQQELDLELLMPGTVDEVSILFKSREMLERFIGWSVAFGWANFNSVERDTAAQVYGNSLQSVPNVGRPAFDVRFEFLRHQHRTFRIEAMLILEGMAVLHEPLAEGAVAHASWKCESEAHYEDTCGLLEAKRMPKMAEYLNSYGRFGYFGYGAPYLKPRVNLRGG